MEINFQLTEDDYLNFNLFHIRHSKTGKRALHSQRWTGPVIFMIASFIFSKIDGTPYLFYFIPFLILSGLWAVFYPMYFFRRVKAGTKKMVREGKNTGFVGDHKLVLSEEGLEEFTSSGQTKVNWSAIENLEEDKDYFFVYNSAVSAYILPKRELTNEDEIREYLISHIQVSS